VQTGLAGKVVIVTAATANIGRGIALAFAAEGARVVIVGRDAAAGQLVAKLAREQGAADVLWRPADMTVDDEVAGMVADTLAAFGQIDVLVNNVGLGGTASVIDMTDEQWSSVLDVTLTATFRATRAVLRHMVPRRAGVIVNNASVLGWRAQAGQAHYAAAKAGVMALTRCAAIEAAPAGVRVNAVAPSLAMHPFLARVTTPELLEELTSREAFGRAAEPWEVASVMAFLASDYASYLTGEVVSVSSQHP
jgi:3-oxoacyl-[acyl-carrier protein] reductase